MTEIKRAGKSGFYAISKFVLGLIGLSIVLFYTSSCTHDPFLPEDNPNDTVPIPDQIGSGCDSSKIFFNRDILPIFVTQCGVSGCHDSRTAEEGYVFTDYAKIIRKGFVSGKPGNSDVYKRITTAKASDVMPPAPLNKLLPNQITAINRWITEGLKNDTCTLMLTTCDTLSVSYRNNVQPIFNQCTGCHGPITNYSGLRLDNYQGARDALNTGRLLGALRWENGFIKMPLDLPQLVGCDIKKIEIWIKNGAMDN